MRKTKREINRAEGSLSVFFSLLFPVFLMLFLTLYMAGRRSIMTSGIQRDAKLASFSVMAEYQADVVREYGLYYVPLTRLGSGFSFFLNENRSHPYGTYEAVSLSVTPEKTLEDPAVLEEEIVHFMEERVLIDSLDEVLALFSELGEAEQMQKEYARFQHSQELMLIQMNYSDLITDVYGIREDGRRNDRAILTFMKDSPRLPELIRAAGTVEEWLLSSTPENEERDPQEIYDEILILEQGKDQIETTLYLLEEAKSLAEILIEQIADLKAQEEIDLETWEGEEPYERLSEKLPVDENKLRSLIRILERNGELVREAGAVLDCYLAEEIPWDGQNILEMLTGYEYEIRLPHESRPVTDKLDLSSIWDYLRGYNIDVRSFAPDEELKLPEDAGSGVTAAGQESDEISPGDLSLNLDLQRIREHFLTEEYALGMCTNLRDTVLSGKGTVPVNLRDDRINARFFSNEVEYLLVGAPNEYRNVNGTKNRIMALRVLLNMFHLMTDPEKRQEIEQAAALTGGILMPGLGDLAAFGLILISWSTFEAAADYRLLSDGGRVPLLKDAESWQTDLFSLLGGDMTEEEKLETKGMSYREYLRVLLLLSDQDKLLSRLQMILRTDPKIEKLGEAVVSFHVSLEAVPQDGWSGSIFFSGVFGYE